ncbi:MAG: molybdopterin-binding protein [Micropruina sp.]|uniref:MogA/MoaB family molybdenum cofactor biosynthesis protein n=1 Tax=Micropruina sp. TaxID=2737536 RepID=UPI0039E6432B
MRTGTEPEIDAAVTAAENALRAAAGLRAAVIVVSSEVASGRDRDRGGPVAVELLRGLGIDTELDIVADDPDAIRTAIDRAAGGGVRVVFCCGGTGIGPHDHTSAVVADLIAFELPGVAEEIRRVGLSHTRQALISREVIGVLGRPDAPPVLLLAIPGSRGGIRDAIGVVGDLLGYIVDQLDGAGHA